ncbi:hypothetical protein ACFSYH_03705 [Populibacterium corticicola]|uniref:Uncharacterized protein n=1 Tax=Populibacterium corticicola TaxID=1812826 RepID=A0ABW5XBI9_9MICO
MTRSIIKTLAAGLIATCAATAAIAAAPPAGALSLSDPTEVPAQVTTWFAENSSRLVDESDRSGVLGTPIPHYVLDTSSMSFLETYPDSFGALYRGDGVYCAPITHHPEDDTSIQGQTSMQSQTPTNTENPVALADDYLCTAVTVSEAGEASQGTTAPHIVTIERENTGYTGQPKLLVTYQGALFTESPPENSNGGKVHALNDKALALFGTPHAPADTFGTWLLSVGQLPLEAPKYVTDWFTNQAPKLINEAYTGSVGMTLDGTNTVEIAHVIPLAYETAPDINAMNGEPNTWLTLTDTPTWDPEVHTYCAQLIIDSALSNYYQCAQTAAPQPDTHQPPLELTHLFEADYSSPSSTYTAPLILISANGAPGYYTYQADHTIYALESWARTYLDGYTMSADTYLATTQYSNAIIEELTRIKQDPHNRALTGANTLEVSHHQTLLREGIANYGHIKLATGIAIGITTTLLLTWATHRYRTRTKTSH